MSSFSAHDGLVLALAFSPQDKNVLASGGSDTLVRLWDVDTERVLSILRGTHRLGRYCGIFWCWRAARQWWQGSAYSVMERRWQ